MPFVNGTPTLIFLAVCVIALPLGKQFLDSPEGQKAVQQVEQKVEETVK